MQIPTYYMVKNFNSEKERNHGEKSRYWNELTKLDLKNHQERRPLPPYRHALILPN